MKIILIFLKNTIIRQASLENRRIYNHNLDHHLNHHIIIMEIILIFIKKITIIKIIIIIRQASLENSPPTRGQPFTGLAFRFIIALLFLMMMIRMRVVNENMMIVKIIALYWPGIQVYYFC